MPAPYPFADRQLRPMEPPQAEALAARALAFLGREEERFWAFANVTGVDAGDVRALAGETGFLAAVLDYLLRDESLLLVFVAEDGGKPQDVLRAYAALNAGEDIAW